MTRGELELLAGLLHRERHFAAQHGPGAFGQQQRGKFGFGDDMPLGHELAQHRAPQRFAEVLADAVGGELVVPVLADLG